MSPATSPVPGHLQNSPIAAPSETGGLLRRSSSRIFFPLNRSRQRLKVLLRNQKDISLFYAPWHVAQRELPIVPPEEHSRAIAASSRVGDSSAAASFTTAGTSAPWAIPLPPPHLLHSLLVQCTYRTNSTKFFENLPLERAWLW